MLRAAIRPPAVVNRRYSQVDTQTLVFSEPLITALSFLFCFCLLAPALYYVWFVYRRRLDHTGLLGGLAAFFLFGYLLTGFLLGALAPGSRKETMAPWGYALLRGLITALVEVGGIWFSLWFLRRGKPAERRTVRLPIGFGLGYRLFDLLYLGAFNALFRLLNAMSVNRDGLESVLEGVEAEAAPALEAQLRLLAESAPRMYWLSAVDYLCMLVISVCAARLLWYSMEGGLKPADIRYLPLVFAVRLVGESLLALYQNGGGSFLACAGSYYVLTAALACFTWYQASQRDSKELLHDEHLKSRMRLKR